MVKIIAKNGRKIYGRKTNCMKIKLHTVQKSGPSDGKKIKVSPVLQVSEASHFDLDGAPLISFACVPIFEPE
ncbi:MAG: hypothetical protein KBT11_00870 [Treponema sp.]|nr:hypothetical protein [Candidatus Treponema equifaecale]